MAAQADRVLKRKRIYSPSDDSVYVDIPITNRAVFVTAADQYQEGHFYFNNTSTSSRKTRVQQVVNPHIIQTLAVERILSFNVKTAAEQYQETAWILTNTDPPPIQPSGEDSPSHQKKHIVRYYYNNDTSSQVWVDVEEIDELSAIVPHEQYQEYRLFMLNDSLGDPVNDPTVPYDVTVGFCDPNLPLADVEPGLDPPYRLDPLQNIVNFSGGTIAVIRWEYHPQVGFFGGGGGIGGGALTGYDFSLAFDGTAFLPPGWIVTGAPTIGNVRWHNSPATEPWVYTDNGETLKFECATSSESVSHTFQFEALEFNSFSSPFIDTGTLDCSISGISLTQDGVPWIPATVAIIMQTDSRSGLTGGDPGEAGPPHGGLVANNPIFIATFLPP